ncbi:hypothetical protein ACQEU3_08040 [Spirillospora sp. CA-253888]
MSVDDLLDEREQLIEEWDEAVEECLADFKEYIRLTRQRERVQAEMAMFNDIYGAIAASGLRVEGDKRQGQIGMVNVLLRVRHAFEQEIVETTLLMRKTGALQQLVERNQAVLSELKRRFPREYRDELANFQQLTDLHAEFAQHQIASAHQAWLASWHGAISSQQMAAENLEKIAPGSAATWRFQVPPNWPPAHPDWSPQPDWRPDPAWDVPEDRSWRFWSRG